VKIEAALRGEASLSSYVADTVILRFEPGEGLGSAELRNGPRAVATLSGPAVDSMRAVDGRMAVYVEGPNGRQGPFEAHWVKMDYPPGTQGATRCTLGRGDRGVDIVNMSNDDLHVFHRGGDAP